MNQKFFNELKGMLDDINPNEIASHIVDDTLMMWLDGWKMKTSMLIAFLEEFDVNQEKII